MATARYFDLYSDEDDKPPDELDIEITFPDEWTMYHKFQFDSGVAAVDGSWSVKVLYGTIALIDKIERNGEPVQFDDIDKMPLSYSDFFEWLIGVVYLGNFLPARSIKKKST